MYTEKQKKSVLAEVDKMSNEIVQFLCDLVSYDTSVPPGVYEDCAHFIGNKMKDFGYEVEYINTPYEYAKNYSVTWPDLPRVNVIGRMKSEKEGPVFHFNGHYDVAPAGEGWDTDPFKPVIVDGNIIGRGSSDQKSGIAASLYAIEAIRRAGLKLNGTLEQSTTPDEEFGGYAGLGYLVQQGIVNKDKVDYCVITECLDVDGICIGHRGYATFSIEVYGRITHGCMPHLGKNPIWPASKLLAKMHAELLPKIEARVTELPVYPECEKPSNFSPLWIDANAEEKPTATCPGKVKIYFNRWFNPNEDPKEVRDEVRTFMEEFAKTEPDFKFIYIDEPLEATAVLVPTDNDLVYAFEKSINEVCADLPGKKMHHKLSPGCDDQRFVVNEGQIDKCILYGPGPLNEAHQPNEKQPINELIASTKIMALAAMRVLGVEED